MSVRVGVVGTGVMGADHARLLDGAVHGAAVSAVADAQPGRAQAVAASLRAARVAEPDELVAAADVDVVVVATADETHEGFVLACLEAGKPVLCEKPLAPTAAGARRLVEAEVQQGRALVNVGFMRRFDPGYLNLKSTLRDGTLGVPLVVHCVHRNAVAAPGATAEQVVTSSIVHEIDVARWLLEEELTAVTVREVHATAASGGLGPVLATFETAGGVVVDVEAWVNARYGYDVRGELVGTEGVAALDARPPTSTWLSGRHDEAVDADWRPRFAEAYRRELQAWVTAIETKAPVPGATAWDGYAAAVVCDAAVAALRSGRREPIEVPARPGLYGGGR